MREHRASLLECEPGELRELSQVLQALVRGYDALFDRRFPYVMVVHQAPTSQPARAGHLHVEFYPPLRTAEKLKFLAGSEQGAGTFISDTLPESRPSRCARRSPVLLERVRAFAPGRVNLIGEHTDYNAAWRCRSRSTRASSWRRGRAREQHSCSRHRFR